MTDQITLTLPDELSLRARQIAESTAQPLEQVLIEHLKTLSPPLPSLPPDVQQELNALVSLSDDTLWTIARDHMPDDAQSRANDLMDKNSRGKLSANERIELEKLVDRADQLMLRKAEAAAILRSRGYPFSQEDFSPIHE
jgi:hypothetical protein